MPRPDFPKTITEFQHRFGTEQACLDYLTESRWPDGFICPRCGSQDYYWKAQRQLFQCAVCSLQTSVTAGTVMHRTKQPLTLWFWAAYLVTTVTPGMSALQFQRQVGLSSYQTAFTMLHKLRAAFVKEERDKLHGTVEVDETYIGGAKEGTRGRGALGKVIVIGAVEVRGEGSGRIRLKVIPRVNGPTLWGFVRDNVEPGSTVRTDLFAGYIAGGDGYIHEPSYGDKSEGMPRIHHVFGNLKVWINGTHHGVSPQHLPAYLNEYVYRFNRRATPMAAFQTALGLIAERKGPTYRGLVGVKSGTGDYQHPNPTEE